MRLHLSGSHPPSGLTNLDAKEAKQVDDARFIGSAWIMSPVVSEESELQLRITLYHDPQLTCPALCSLWLFIESNMDTYPTEGIFRQTRSSQEGGVLRLLFQHSVASYTLASLKAPCSKIASVFLLLYSLWILPHVDRSFSRCSLATCPHHVVFTWQVSPFSLHSVPKPHILWLVFTGSLSAESQLVCEAFSRCPHTSLGLSLGTVI